MEEQKQLDWDITEEYFQADESKEELKLEDFMTEEDENEYHQEGSGELEKTAEDVKQVLKRSAEGMTIREIAEALKLEEEYVYNIQLCAQSFADSDPVSVAHMILMG
ncbi:MAG: helix-turn-helix domain-containing protein [Lachnospiraceae bacterium]|nr:helix-turn-helix domain-containing protein [Lachnospiraceae bacterium]